MWGTLSPDQRPTDLGTHDAGFDFRTTDAPPREFIWSQTAWVETTQDNDAQLAYATSALVLTTTAADVPGATLTLNRAGRYLIQGNFSFLAVDPSTTLRGRLMFNGVVQSFGVLAADPGQAYMTSTTQWLVTATAAGQIAKLQGSKDSGTGSSQINASFTSISALWIGP